MYRGAMGDAIGGFVGESDFLDELGGQHAAK
jgi:hypothetical protein